MVGTGDLLQDIAGGFHAATSVETLLYCFLGVLVGNFIGVLPGVGVLATISMLMPLTYYVDPMTAIIMLAGIYYGASYGGSTASILLNLPGTPNTAITCLDGYPMTKQGRAGIALFITTISSFVGTFVGIVILAFFSPPLAAVALQFGSEEYFALMVLGLVAASLLSSGAPFRSLTMVAFGLLLGTVGTDVNTGIPRFTFGLLSLYDGLPLVAVALGLFGLPEMIANAGKLRRDAVDKKVSLRSILPTAEDWRRSWKAMLRGTGVGAFVGALPGSGSAIAAFLAYAVEKRVHKDESQFGKGAIEGVSGPEAANNAAVQTAFIPTLTLGIPGDAVMALMLGVFMIHGLIPGPQLIGENPTLFWGLVVSFLFGNIMLLVLNIPLIGIWVRILSIPYHLLYPSMVVFVCIGVYSIDYAVADLVAVLVFGLLGYGMYLLRFEPAPLLLGFILGPMMEEHLRRAMILSQGDPATFLTHPISAVFLGLSLMLVGWVAIGTVRRARRAKAAPGD